MEAEKKSEAREALDALEDLIASYKELCDDARDNDIQYQLWNLTSPYHVIKRNLERLEEYEDIRKNHR